MFARIMREGFVAGLIGAAAVALWFLVVDLARFKDLFFATIKWHYRYVSDHRWKGFRVLGVDGTSFRVPDTKENKKIIEKDEKTFEVIKYEQLFRFDGTRQMATLGMVYKDTFVLLFRHDAYLTAQGDTLDASWKIIRTIQ